MRNIRTQTFFKRAAFVLPVTLVGLFASANAYGSTIILDSALTNPSFEANPNKTNCPTGWTCGGTLGNPGFATSYVVTSAQYTAGADGLASGIVPFGVAAGTMPFPVEGSGSIMQTGLGSYVSGNTYTVDLWIGTPNHLPNDNVTPTDVVGRITAYFLGNGGAQLLAIDLTPPAKGQWKSAPVSFTPTGGQIGQTIGFQIFVDSAGNFASGNNRIADFDIGAVPEPATFALMGLGLLGLGVVRKKLQR